LNQKDPKKILQTISDEIFLAFNQLLHPTSLLQTNKGIWANRNLVKFGGNPVKEI